ncbi:UNVERIFIED_CONTAM: hypothetical protein Slati_2133800 [Sesamum latifolium]|uniref:Tf2-1-like SH3-like domain-containing protein n=1 Tax=Sesamum latifolium TaxID=2727402 RepID=A0AAW2WS76_9LAMI
MLRACVLDFKGGWSDYQILIEFSYNNNYHSSIGVAPYEALYGRKCRSPLCWNEVREKVITRLELVQETVEKVATIRKRLKEAKIDKRVGLMSRGSRWSFTPGDKVYLKIAPTQGVIRFGRSGKLSPRYMGPYDVLEKVGEGAYRIASLTPTTSKNP